jgi:membrane-associated PAP2 superfamily phosphatase
MRPTTRRYLRDLAAILLPGMALLAVLPLVGIDQDLATTVYDRSSAYGWFIREYGQMPAAALGWLALAVIALRLMKKGPDSLGRLAVLWVLTLAIGSGILTNLVFKEHTERPRPLETTLLGGTHDYRPPFSLPAGEGGKSFPSGHAAMGFMLATLYFALRDSRPRWAYAALAAGLAWGVAVGLGRMVLGAHFATDVVGSAMMVLLSAATLSWLMTYRWRAWGIAAAIAVLAVASLGLMYVQELSEEKTIALTGDAVQVNLPCDRANLVAGTGTDTFQARVVFRGQGGPGRGLMLTVADHRLTLKTAGLFRKISCVADITLPPGTRALLPPGMSFSSVNLTPMPLTEGAEWRIFSAPAR